MDGTGAAAVPEATVTVLDGRMVYAGPAAFAPAVFGSQGQILGLLPSDSSAQSWQLVSVADILSALVQWVAVDGTDGDIARTRG